MDEDLRQLERAANTGDGDAHARLSRHRARSGVQRLAVISDVHGNLEALTAVLDDIDRQGVGEVICLGDLVGYGPNPAECIDLAMRRCAVVLQGDFDARVIDVRGTSLGIRMLNATARAVNGWQRDQLRPRLLSGPVRRRRWAFLRSLPLTHREGLDLYVHGSPRDPLLEFVMLEELHWNHEKFTEILHATDRLVFLGHTHQPWVIWDSLEGSIPKEIDHSFRLEAGRKAIVNVGSVGQPRDRDPRACYAIQAGDVITWRRVDYDVERTIAKMESVRVLPESYRLRLRLGA